MQKHELTPLEKWESLTLADNFIFCKVMEDNPDVCKELLEMLLEIKIDRIEKPVSERNFKVDFDSKGIRFDVYVKDGTGRCFDIEIQTSHFTNLSKRARYYQGLMDVDNVQAGADYDVLKESYVIFLCLGDPFKKGLPVYTFSYRAKEDNSLQMNDGTTNIFFNAKEYDKMKSETLCSFFRFLCRQPPSSDFTDKLSVLIERVKTNPQWRHRYMTWEQEMKIQAKILGQEIGQKIGEEIAREKIEAKVKEARAEALKEGITEGQNEKAIETAKNFLANGVAAELVSKCTGLSLEEVLKLQKEI